MKTWHVVALAVVLGVGLGIATTILRIRLAPWDGTAAGVREKASLPPRLQTLLGDHVPKVTVDREVFDYGLLDSQTPATHDFVLSNAGTGLLTLTKGGSSCKCTKFDLEKPELHPGQSAKVTMEWKATTGDGPFRNTGTVRTNDPERPQVTLTVTGQVTTAIKTIPGEVEFTRVQAGQPATAAIRLLGYLPERFRIEKHEFLEPKYAQYFQVKIEPMTADQLAAENRTASAGQPDDEKKPPAAGQPADEKKPLKADPRRREKEVKCGYVADLTVKAGLPVGTFRQLLRLTTNVKTTPTITIPITGSVVSEDLVVAGANYGSGVLDIDVVSAEKESTRTLKLIASGPHYKAIDFQVLEVQPSDVLQVEIGKPSELGRKAGTQTTLTIRIPKGSRPVNCLGTEQSPMGRILLKTNHPSPEAGKLLIRVKFAVAG